MELDVDRDMTGYPGTAWDGDVRKTADQNGAWMLSTAPF